MKNIIKIGIVGVLALLLMHNVSRCVNGGEHREYCDTLRVTVVDTIAYYKPIAKDSTVVRYEVMKLPVNERSGISNKDQKNIPMLEELERIDKEVDFPTKADSAQVVIPIEQKVYEDSTYRAVVSGFRASLDSITVYPTKEIITINNPGKRKRWSIGIHVGYGMTLKESPIFTPYIGVGLQYNLFSF